MMPRRTHHRRRRLPLQDLALASASLRAYNSALNRFLLHHRLDYSTFLSMPAPRLDWLLAVFIQRQYDAREPFTYSAHAFHAAVYHRQELKQLLPQARQCLRGWERSRSSTSHPPLTWELTVLIACTLARSGYLAPAVGMLVAFDCYLRVGELTRLRRCDIVLPHDARMGGHATNMAVVLKQTKTGENQSVELYRPEVAEVLSFWVRTTLAHAPPSTPVFPFTATQLRTLLHRACAELGLGGTPYVPHSLRHGGASADFLRTNDIAYVQFRGRWKSMESARLYIQTARAMLAAHAVPQPLHELGTLLATALPAVIADAAHAARAHVHLPGRRVRFQL
jgi:integrase